MIDIFGPEPPTDTSRVVTRGELFRDFIRVLNMAKDTARCHGRSVSVVQRPDTGYYYIKLPIYGDGVGAEFFDECRMVLEVQP